DRSVYLGGGRATTLSSLVGNGLELATGGVALYSGLHSGGVQGGLQAGAGVAGILSGTLPLLSKSLGAAGPIGAIVGAGLGLVSALFGDPKQKFAEKQSKALRDNRFFAAPKLDIVSDEGGRLTDYDYMGVRRGGSAYD